MPAGSILGSPVLRRGFHASGGRARLRPNSDEIATRAHRSCLAHRVGRVVGAGARIGANVHGTLSASGRLVGLEDCVHRSGRNRGPLQVTVRSRAPPARRVVSGLDRSGVTGAMHYL
jgi:hypothetical protein